MRIELLILLAGLACTVFGKYVIVRSHHPSNLPVELSLVVFPDILFFASMSLFMVCLYIFRPSDLMARCALLISVVVSFWAILNTMWLIQSGVQLQPGILKVLAHNSGDLWPIIQPYIANDLTQMVLIGTITLAACVYVLWRLVKPASIATSRNHHIRFAFWKVMVVLVLLACHPLLESKSEASLASSILGFSSHWHALRSILPDSLQREKTDVQLRDIPRIGQRIIEPPTTPKDQLPNIVLVLMESVSYSATPFGNSKLDTMPNLARLADEGVEFCNTHVPVSHTTKAFWATLTSSTPAIQSDYIEAIPVDQPYESLASILARVGYKSGFFEMCRGSFECAPGFFNNLAFDWAWFRENLEDPSAHLGVVTGDDCRIIKPALDWASKDDRPFLLTMITTIAHEPYDVPAWFDKPKEKEYANYLQCVRFTDFFLGELQKQLTEYGLDDNTIICVIGDHGTSFGTENNKARWSPREEVIRVPWVMHWPGHVQAGQRINWPCSQLDVTPTILNLIGFDVSHAGFDGKDAFTPSDPERRLYFHSWLSESPLGFIEGNKKMVYWPYIDKMFGYDLIEDPLERDPEIISGSEKDLIKKEILDWQHKSKMRIDPKRYTEELLFSHWQTFSSGNSAWAFYIK